MTPKEKYQKLVDLLHVRTMSKDIDWNYDEQLEIYAKVGNRIVVLTQGRNENDEPLEIVNIVSGNWEVIDSLNDEMFNSLDTAVSRQYGSYFSVMNVTRKTAYRQAIGADEAIDDLLNALDKED